MRNCLARAWSAAVGGGLVLVLVLGACGGSSSGFTPVPPEDMIDSGSWYARESWPHDGNPVESEHFVVYSDAASPEARRAMAELAEELWAQVLSEFEVDESALIFPPDRDKIDIYAYQNYDPTHFGMRAYQAGFIGWSSEHPTRNTGPNAYDPIIKHELVHVLETLLKGRDSIFEPMTDAWFSEGLAEAVVGGTAGGPVLGRDQLSDLLAAHDGQNPVALRRDTWYDNDNEFHYPMFQLAVDYLLDSEGGNRTLTDARGLFMEMADGTTTFEEAFNAHMGITLNRYETEFFTKVEPYLPAHRNPFFYPVGIAVLALVFGGLGIGALAYSGRRNSRAAPVAARAGFYASTGLGALIAIGGSFGLLALLNTRGDWYNRTIAPIRVLFSGLIVVFFIAAVAALAWVQRRWGKGSRIGYTGLPIVIALAGLTFLGAVWVAMARIL